MSEIIQLLILKMDFYLIIVGRLILACVLGGFVGYEREHTNRPAGFRTHILVCVGAALVMCTSEFLFEKYNHITTMDPARLGAQVISGIGFLGAGTIIRQGFNIRGLTTAASLWAVACVGIAAGIGFYEGAIIATLFIYITLIVLKNLENLFWTANNLSIIYIKSKNIINRIGQISDILTKHSVLIKNIEFIESKPVNGDSVLIKVIVRIPRGAKKTSIINDLYVVEGIEKVYEE